MEGKLGSVALDFEHEMTVAASSSLGEGRSSPLALPLS